MVLPHLPFRRTPGYFRPADLDGRDRYDGNATERTIRLWDATTGKEIATFPGDGCTVAVAFSPDGNSPPQPVRAERSPLANAAVTSSKAMHGGARRI